MRGKSKAQAISKGSPRWPPDGAWNRARVDESPDTSHTNDYGL